MYDSQIFTLEYSSEQTDADRASYSSFDSGSATGNLGILTPFSIVSMELLLHSITSLL